MADITRINISFPNTLLERVADVSKQYGYTTPELIREATRRYLKHLEDSDERVT